MQLVQNVPSHVVRLAACGEPCRTLQEEIEENVELFEIFVLELSHQITAKHLTDARVSYRRGPIQ